MSDWKITTIGDLLRVRNGRSQREIETRYGKYPILATGGEIGRTDTAIYSKPSVLIGRKGTINRPQFQESPFWTVDTLFYTEVGAESDPEFLYNLFCTIDWMSLNEATGVPSLTGKRIESISVRVPMLKEQRSIAKVLRNVAKLIASLEGLISKKQDIKQGIMQELLTGRTRLPGFAGEWLNKSAGELGSFHGGNGFPVRYQGVKNESIPFFKVSDMNLAGNEKYMIHSNNAISELSRMKMGAAAFPNGAVVFAKVGAAVFLERKRILSRASCIDNNMAAFVIDSKIADNLFIYYSMLNVSMSSLVAIGALPSLNAHQLRSIPLKLPKDLTEQRAIASLLSDVDTEIGALERRLELGRYIRQGMMQQLLTSRIRLPVGEAAV